MHKSLIQHNCQQQQKKPLTFRLNNWMVQNVRMVLTSQLISPINTDLAMFIGRGTPVLSFSKNFSRYQNSEILCCLNVVALSNFYMYTGYYKFNMDWNLFFSRSLYDILQIIIFIRMFDIQYWKCNSTCHIWKIKKGKTKNLNVVYSIKHINGYF